jgi:predicted Zn-dependent peptidase
LTQTLGGCHGGFITPIDENVRELISNLKNQQEQEEEKYHQQERQNEQLSYRKNNANNNNNTGSTIDIQDIAPSSSINAKIIIVDKQDSLAMEIKDGIKDNLYDTVGLST